MKRHGIIVTLPGSRLLSPGNPLDDLFKRFLQLVIIHRFENIIAASQLHGRPEIRVFVVAGNENAFRPGIICLNPLKKIQSRPLRHFNVAQKQIDFFIKKNALGLRHGSGGKRRSKAEAVPVNPIR